jgi:hypothetical protein
MTSLDELAGSLSCCNYNVCCPSVGTSSSSCGSSNWNCKCETPNCWGGRAQGPRRKSLVIPTQIFIDIWCWNPVTWKKCSFAISRQPDGCDHIRTYMNVFLMCRTPCLPSSYVTNTHVCIATAMPHSTDALRIKYCGYPSNPRPITTSLNVGVPVCPLVSLSLALQ